jgi:hypothetical protein
VIVMRRAMQPLCVLFRQFPRFKIGFLVLLGGLCVVADAAAINYPK